VPDLAIPRRTMVDRQVRTYDVTDRRILAALGEVPREAFMPVGQRPFAYSDAELPVQPLLAPHLSRSLMGPGVFARLVQLADVQPTDIVLDVGCATGYSSAVLARLADSVVALETDDELAAAATMSLIDYGALNVAVVTGPLAEGYASEGPYDVIVLGGSVPQVPQALLGQLKDGGRLVAIVGTGGGAQAMLYLRTGADIAGRAAFNAPAPALPGFEQARSFAF